MLRSTRSPLAHWASSLWYRVAPAAPLRDRLAKGSMWLLVGALTSQGLRLAAFVVAARFLGREGFGALGMLQNTVSMVGVFAGVGIGLTATKHVAEFRHTDAARAGRVIGLSLLVASISGLGFTVLLRRFAEGICSTLLDAPHLADELALAALLVVLNTVLGAQTGALAGLERFRSIATVNLAQGVLAFPAVLTGVWLHGLSGAVFGLIVSAVAGVVLNHLVIIRECHLGRIDLSYSLSRREWALLASFSLPALLSGVMNVPAHWAVTAILVNQQGGYAEMGAFSAANQWRLLILFLPTILERTSLPILTDLYARRDFASYRRTLRTHLLFAAGGAALVAVPVSLGSPFILSLYGEGFAAEWQLLPVLAGSAVLASANTAVGTLLSSRGAMWLALLMNCVWAMLLMAAAWLLTPAYGALGLALSFLVAYGACSIWQFYYWYRVERALGLRTPQSAMRLPQAGLEEGRA